MSFFFIILKQWFFPCHNNQMSMNDGKRIVQKGRSKRLQTFLLVQKVFALLHCIFLSFESVVSCTRWAELAESIRFHISLARAAGAPMEIRFLNSAGPILIGKGPGHDEDGSPNGATTLCRHIREVIVSIREMEPVLLDARRPMRTGQCLRFLLGAQANAPSSSGDGRLLLLSVTGGSGIYGSFFLCAAQKLSMMKVILSLFCTRRNDNNFDLSTTLL